MEHKGSAEERQEVHVAAAVTVLMLGVPVLMAAENWDDHD